MPTLQLLGTPVVLSRGRTDGPGVLLPAKTLAVLGILAMSGSAGVRRPRLTAMLWPALDAERARNALNKAVHQVRRVCGEQALGQRLASTLQLDRSDWECDVWRFEQAVRTSAWEHALALFEQGTFLSGLELSASADYEHWLDDTRAHLRQRALVAVRALVASAEAAGQLPVVHRALQLGVRVSPFDEGLIRTGVTTLETLGDRGGAMRLYADFERRLVREFETRPSMETRQLITRLRGASMSAPALPALV
jgi:DNA-binding SARP family transcriptional activator